MFHTSVPHLFALWRIVKGVVPASDNLNELCECSIVIACRSLEEIVGKQTMHVDLVQKLFSWSLGCKFNTIMGFNK